MTDGLDWKEKQNFMNRKTGIQVQKDTDKFQKH